MTDQDISYQAARQSTLEHILPLEPVEISMDHCAGYAAAEDIRAPFDSPTTPTSMKDGYAVRHQDTGPASDQRPVKLKIAGTIAAGQNKKVRLTPGTAYRVLTGGRMPQASDAVIAEEFVSRGDAFIHLTGRVKKGENILEKGGDIREGETLIRQGELLTPARVGLLVSGGLQKLQVFPKPKVAILATGDEIILPGEPCPEGKRYAGNLMTIHSWCRNLGCQTRPAVVGDKETEIRDWLARAARSQDMIITSGGSWKGDRDLTVKALRALGWEKVYHHIRLRPGKTAGFGLLNQKPVFVLPGSPSANLVSFLLLALPGLFRLCGRKISGLPEIQAVVTETVQGRSGRTDVVFGHLDEHRGETVFIKEKKHSSRLKMMADAQALLMIPEGVSCLEMNQRGRVMVVGGELYPK